MSIASVPDPLALHLHAAVPTEPIWRLSIEQYHQMVRTGILTDEDPVELLEGWLLPKMPKDPPHRVASRLVRKALAGLLPAGWYVDSQEPGTLDNSEPEPDVVIVRGETRRYLERHPGARDLALIVEVADATLQRDRGPKKRLYAQAGVPVYWIANLIDRQIEVYTDASGPAERPEYRLHQDYGPSDMMTVVIEGREIGRLAVQELLP